MNSNKAVVIANKTSEGLSVIDIHVYDENGRMYSKPTKRFIDDINALPLLDETKVKFVIQRQYGVSADNVKFN